MGVCVCVCVLAEFILLDKISEGSSLIFADTLIPL